MAHPGFFASRWHGEVPLARLLWRDLLVAGTALNLVASFVALAVLALGGPPWLAVALHFGPLPYNVFLFSAVLRSPERSSRAVVIAALWLAAMMVV